MRFQFTCLKRKSKEWSARSLIKKRRSDTAWKKKNVYRSATSFVKSFTSIKRCSMNRTLSSEHLIWDKKKKQRNSVTLSILLWKPKKRKEINSLRKFRKINSCQSKKKLHPFLILTILRFKAKMTVKFLSTHMLILMIDNSREWITQ